MNVEDFIAAYKKSANTGITITNRLQENQYIPYEEKQADCERMVHATSWKQNGDQELFWINSPSRWYLFAINIINRYTDIEFSADGTELLKEYNDLVQCGALDEIMSIIRSKDWLAREYAEYETMLNMVLNDATQNNQSAVNFFKGLNDDVKVIVEQLLVQQNT